MTILKKLPSKRFYGYALFWSWNLIFLAFMLLGFAPQVLPGLRNGVQTQIIPAEFLVYAAVLTMIPVAAVLLGATILRKQPAKLLALGYGVQGPLMLLLAIRFFLIRDITPAISLLLGSALLGLLTFFWHIVDRRADERSRWTQIARLAGLTVLLLVGLYASLWIAFYAIPLAAFALEGASQILGNLTQSWNSFWRGIQEILYEGGFWIPFYLLGALLFLFTATLFVLMPLAIPALVVQAWWQGLQRVSDRRWSFGTTTAVFLIAIFAFPLANRQPQANAFALLDEKPKTAAEARALLAQRDDIRAGLLNAYLAPQRYLSAKGEVFHIADLYREAFDWEAEQVAVVYDWYEWVATPMLYRPVNDEATLDFDRWRGNTVFNEEGATAAELYQNFFDESIIDGEKEAVVQAMRATWNTQQANEGWRAVDDREIYLVEQQINVTPSGDWAEIELFETYQNQTALRQEVVYYVTLPESAVITAVSLGNSPDRDDAFTHRVAPRGAAQAVYRNEVRRNVDPALVEQIGPSQYRIRIFPVEPVDWIWDEQSQQSIIEEAQPLYFWLSYRALAADAGWPLPYLADGRNVYWDDDTVRLLNGEPWVVDDGAWLPTAVSAEGVTPATHRVDFGNGESVIAIPAVGESFPTATPARLALVLDTSLSMAEYESEISATLEELRGLAADVTIYLTASEFGSSEPSVVSLDELNSDDLLFYGGQNAVDLLVQYEALRQRGAVDAVLVLTDGTGYSLADTEAEIAVPTAPVWMIHLGGSFPIGYGDATLAAIQASGGGTVGSLDEARRRLGVALATGQSGAVDVVDGYVWRVLGTETAVAEYPNATPHGLDDGFAAFAARRLILSEMVENHRTLDSLETLDQLHALAVEQSIVTPYSSMIVLVEERQERLLDELEQQDDRFEREFEDVGETEGVPVVTGVPEPEEWLLIMIGAILLVWYVRKQRQARPALRIG